VIYKRYGSSYHSVDLNFDGKAMTEVGFRRSGAHSFEVEALGGVYEHMETVELATESEGPVQTETEQLMLDRLREKIEGIGAALPEGGIALVENESGHDYPKPRQEIKNVVVEGENRLHFHYTMAPALRLGLYELKS
jgi:hypothetical protein